MGIAHLGPGSAALACVHSACAVVDGTHRAATAGAQQAGVGGAKKQFGVHLLTAEGGEIVLVSTYMYLRTAEGIKMRFVHSGGGIHTVASF